MFWDLVKEPAFGNLIRNAIQLGYTIIGYEHNRKSRELNQAKNIAKIIESDSEAKIVIHCGYGHLIESPRMGKDGKLDTLMAGYLKEFTGINPFTIDQTAYYNLEGINKYISHRTNSLSPQFFSKDDKVFKSLNEAKQEYWDLTIFYPHYEFTDGRPAWLSSDRTLNTFAFNTNDVCIDFPIRIKLLEINDRWDAVPVDIVELEKPMANCNLYGYNELGKVVVENIKGDRQIIKVESSAAGTKN